MTSALADEDGIGTFAYQWADADGDISGATSSTYSVPSCDGLGDCTSVLGKAYTVTATHTDSLGTSQTMATSAATSAITLNPSGDLDGDGIINSADTDDDGDGWIDSADAFPADSGEWIDTDSDGIGNNADTDDDGDGTCDTAAVDTGICTNGPDDFPLDSTEQWDADGDGYGHNADADDDGDGIDDWQDDDDDGDGESDSTDAFPNNYNEWVDTDTDGIGNNGDTDDDGDGYDDSSDAFPLDSSEWIDTDGDGTGDNADTDDDGDGYSDADETTNCGEGNDPLDATDTPTDTDGDLSCNALDTDDDGDGYDDSSDAFPLDSTEWVDYDNDGTGDNADTDDDNDGVADATDAFDNDVDAWDDTDGDGLADDFPNLQVTTGGISTACDSSADTGYSYIPGIAWSCSFTIATGDSMTFAYDSYYSYAYVTGALLYPDGTTAANFPAYTYGLDGTYGPFTTPGTYTFSVTADPGYYTVDVEATIDSGPVVTATPATSPAGTSLDYDDDGDGVSDADEAAAGTDPLDTDSDDDGDDDFNDQFPLNSAEWDDTDGDAPAGSDGTGYGDNSDAFPTDACANVDTDGDGLPNTIVSGCTTTLNEDVDDDGDGVLDAYDAFPLDATETTDTDSDGIGNNADTDDDGDAWPDTVDWAPLDSTEWLDSDGDGIGDNNDADDDNDGTPDESDAYDRDWDDDGWDDAWEVACGTDSTDSSSTPGDYDADSSGDSGSVDSAGAPNGVNLCNAVDTDDDNDGYLDVDDAFDFDVDAWTDTDGDGAADTVAPDIVVSNDVENFDSGSAGLTFVNSGTHDWAVATDYANSGTYSMIAGPTDQHSRTYTMTLTVTTYAGDMSFNYLTQTEYDFGCDSYDYMTFSVDGSIVTRDCGTSSAWESYTHTLTAGSHTLTWTYKRDSSWCSAGSSCTGVNDFVAVDDISLPTSQTVGYPSVTIAGTPQDYDDDNDGYSDLDETTNCNDGSAYASTSLPLDATSIPSDMDGDLTCDALDSDRDGDSYSNSADVFPDDANEWADNDADGTGDNGDTDDDNDGTPDLTDPFPMDECAAVDTDSDGKPDSIVAGCSTTLVLDIDDDNDNTVDAVDAFPLDATETTDTDGDGVGDNADTDDDGDGVADSSDVWPLNACASSDFDGDGGPDSLVAGCMGSTVGFIGFEGASTGSMYTDTGNSSLNHTLANNAGEASVSYSSASTTACMTTSSSGAFSYAGDFTCSFTVNPGEIMVATAYSYYTSIYHPITLTGPSGNLLISADYGDSGSAFTGSYGPYHEAGTYTWHQDNTGGFSTYNMIAFMASVSGTDVGYSADYISTGGVGLTDGDYFGVTNYATTVGAFPEGTQGYQMSDVDGIVQLSTGSVADADSVSLDLFVQSTGWESADYIIISYVGASSTTELLNTSGYDIDTDFAAYEGVWTTVSGAVSGSGYLMVEFSSNSGTEAIYIDNVKFMSDGLDVDDDDDNDGYNDTVDDCPFDATENIDTDGDGYCDIQDVDDDNDGVYDWNDLFPLDANESSDNDGDGIGDNADTDDDNDGVDDANDAFPNDASEWADADGDGFGDNADLDDDNDGVNDDMDAWPLDSSRDTDTDGDGIADYANVVTPGESFDFETGAIPANITTLWGYSQCTGYGNTTYGSTGSCTPTTIHNDWTVSTIDTISGNYSLRSGQLASGYYGEVTVHATFFTTGGSINWNYKVSSVERTYSTQFHEGLKVFIDGVQIDASGYGGCFNGEWCGERSGFMSYQVGPGTHKIEFTFDFGTSGSGGSSTAWIDDLALPNVMIPSNLDTDDDNDGVLDDDDIASLDPCLGLDTDGDGLADSLGSTMLNGSACDPSAYTIDDDDDNDAWLDSDEVTCGSDPLVANSTPADYDGDLVCDAMDADDDNDGYDDDVDAFPQNASEVNDNDLDGIGDNADTDDDNDGVADGLDAFPNDATETEDFDGDGVGNNADTDDDDDGVLDADDAFPLNPSEWDDTDGDGIGNNADPDDDGDGVADVADPFPLDASETSDDDNDGIGNNADTDDDNDGYDDADDAFPEDSTEWSDMDGDGQGDNSDADDDGDGVNDGIDVFPTDSSEWIDTDGDGIGDNSDTDDDGDGIADADDAFPLNPSEDSDLDGDGLGDNADSDDDNDGVSDSEDAFPEDSTEWLDTDDDGTGDNEDTDDDGDGNSDAREEECGSNSLDDGSAPADYDGDGICDAVDEDNTDGPSYVPDEDTSLGWSNVVPGFPALFAAIALVGAALLGRRKDD